MKKSAVFLFVGILNVFFGFGQALDQIGKEKRPFKINGGISANQIVYAQTGLDANRRNPYNYFLSGNLNLSLYGLSMPFSFTYSNQNTQFQQPFNQFTLTPTYKWAKFYAGYNTMSFSPYTYNGHIFLGGGVQLTPPGLFKGSLFWGRLNQAVEEDTSNTAIIPYYLRWGGGLKIGVGKGPDGIDLVLFMAKDDPNSLTKPLLKNQLKPMENAVWSLSFTKAVFKRLMLSGEWANSALTSDANASLGSQPMGVFSIFPTFRGKQSTGFFQALKLGAQYSHDTWSLGAGYERIDPGYRTLGAYYFNEDLENITGNGSLRLFTNKVNLSGSFGTQRNNLSKDKMTQMNRWIGSLSVSYAPSTRLSLQASYSNFQTFSSVRRLTPIEQQQLQLDSRLNGNPDTLRFVQLTQSANLSIQYGLTKAENTRVKRTLSCQLAYQTAGEKKGEGQPSITAGTQFYNGNLNLSNQVLNTGLTYTVGCNVNYNMASGANNLLVSPTWMVSKSMLNKRLKPSLSVSYSYVQTNGIKTSDVINARLGGSYTFFKKHAITTTFTMISKNPFQTYPSETAKKSQAAFTEFTWNLGYSFSF